MDEQLQLLKAKYDEWLGMESELLPWEDAPDKHVALVYKSPTGIHLFTIELSHFRGNWQFACRSMAIPANVDELQTMKVDKPKKAEKEKQNV